MIDYAEEEGQIIVIVHFTKGGEPVLLEILDAREFMMKSLTSLLQEKEVVLP